MLATPPLSDALKTTLQEVRRRGAQLRPERRRLLAPLVRFIVERDGSSNPIALNYICTHNSRRSHLGQVWAAALGTAFGFDVQTFSGGTEATACNPRTIAALERAGFEVAHGSGDNPHYLVHFSKAHAPVECFSKVFDAPSNPTQDFAAILTCSSADAACPILPGAALRVATPYDDPKIADGTPAEDETYDDRVLEIGSEVHHVFAEAAKLRQAR